MNQTQAREHVLTFAYPFAQPVPDALPMEFCVQNTGLVAREALGIDPALAQHAVVIHVLAWQDDARPDPYTLVPTSTSVVPLHCITHGTQVQIYDTATHHVQTVSVPLFDALFLAAHPDNAALLPYAVAGVFFQHHPMRDVLLHNWRAAMHGPQAA